MKTITVKIPEDLLEKIDKYAKEHNLNRSDVIRLAIEEFFRPHTNTYTS